MMAADDVHVFPPSDGVDRAHDRSRRVEASHSGSPRDAVTLPTELQFEACRRADDAIIEDVGEAGQAIAAADVEADVFREPRGNRRLRLEDQPV
jgi:hypothetical protein